VKTFKLVNLGGETSDLFLKKPELYDSLIRISVCNVNTNFRSKKRKGIILTTNCMNKEPRVWLIFSKSWENLPALSHLCGIY